MMMNAEVSFCTACSKNPEEVLLACGHHVCKCCLQRGWRGSYQCTVCGGVSKEESLLRGSLPAAGKRQDQTDVPGRPQTETRRTAAEPHEVLLCGRHGERAKLLCLEDKQFLCDQCRGDDQQHKGHKCCSLQEEAAIELKKELETLLVDLGAKLEILRDSKDTYAQAAEHIMHQARDSEEKIKGEFARLHQFLHDEEASRIATMREEEEQKSKTMKSKIAKLSEEMRSLSNTISKIEELTADGMSLQSMVAAVESARCPWQHPEGIGAGALISVATHLGNLGFRVWDRMQNVVQYCPVILDPNTADHRLSISPCLTHVSISTAEPLGQLLPDNPERYDTFACVLGSRGLESGSHCWEVDVEDNSSWEVGVCSGSGPRKGEDVWSGVCSVEFWDEEYYGRLPGQQDKEHLQVSARLDRIRVRLDWDGGELTFSDPASGTNLLTLKHAFTEQVLPFFYNGCDVTPLTVIPAKHSIVITEMK